MSTASFANGLQIEFAQPSQPFGQSMLHGQPNENFYNIHFTKFLILYLLFEQSISSLKQFEMHAESVGSQVAMHSSVSSTQISLQTVLRS